MYFILCSEIYFSQKGSVGFTRISKGSMTQEILRTPEIDVSSSSSSSSYICHGVGPLVDSFRSHVSRSILKGLPLFLLPFAE